MALTGTDRGSGSRNTGSETSYAITPGSNLTAGALAILCVAYDNAGSGGSDPFSTITDTKNNTWTSRQDVLNDPNNPNAGHCLRIFTTPQDVGTLTTGDTITVSFGSTTVVARSYTLMEFTGSLGTPIYKTGNKGTGSSTTPSIVSGSIPDGNAIVGAMGAEGNATITADSDSTNGNWSTQQTSGVGTTAAGSEITSQRKIVTGTATQTYNLTITSADWCIAWIQIAEAITLTPTTLSQTTSPFTPTIRLPKLATPTTLGQTATTFAPTSRINNNFVPTTLSQITTFFIPNIVFGTAVIPTTLSQTITTFSSIITVGINVIPSILSQSLSFFTPTVQINNINTPSTLTQSLSFFTPTVPLGTIIIPSTLDQSFNSFEPSIRLGSTVTPTTLNQSLSFFNPTIYTPVLVTVPTIDNLLSTFIPILTSTIITNVYDSNLTEYEPTITVGSNDPSVVTPTTLNLISTLYTPNIPIGTILIPSTLTISDTQFAPTISVPQTFTPSTIDTNLNFFIPQIILGNYVYTDITNLIFTEQIPQANLTILTNRLDLTTQRFAPSIEYSYVLVAGTKELNLTEYPPTIPSNEAIEIQTLNLILTKYRAIPYLNVGLKVKFGIAGFILG